MESDNEGEKQDTGEMSEALGVSTEVDDAPPDDSVSASGSGGEKARRSTKKGFKGKESTVGKRGRKTESGEWKQTETRSGGEEEAGVGVVEEDDGAFSDTLAMTDITASQMGDASWWTNHPDSRQYTWLEVASQQPGGCGLVTPQELAELTGVHSLRVLEKVLGMCSELFWGRVLELPPFSCGEGDSGSG
ncbi:hypothetical protein AAFF_G00013460 [Aldrovandia affinis]|uniref:Uncharacterized protein n=1 Tax=Aldrovandia affinis TaxID=143900 RepID=A0AAD7WH31_9TELE|nr:hypothetical protein AAFF_G00013460 [Aldrovandia affinis]